MSTSTTSAATNMPVRRTSGLLQQEDTRRVWRGAGGAAVLESVFFDFGSVQSDINQVSLIYTNLAAVDATRCRLSVADPTCVTNTYDSTSIAGRVDPNYRSLHFLTTPVSSPRYGRIDLTRAAGSPEGGFLHAGPYTQYSINYAFGAQRTWVDPSEQKKTKGGQTKIRAAEVSAHVVPDGLPHRDRALGAGRGDGHRQRRRDSVLFFFDPSSTNLGRDSIYGLLTEVSPVAAIQAFGSDGLGMFSRPYVVDERL
jgi:hypothetical protein